MPTRGGNRGKHSLGRSDALAISRKGTRYTIAQKSVTGRFIQLSKDELFNLADILDEVCEALERHQARPNDAPEGGDRCKDCGEDITWLGPSQYNWIHVNEQ